jgi:hypothetical protein
MKKRNYTIGERAIIVLGIKAGHTVAKINQVLVKDQIASGRTIRLVPHSSYVIVKNAYNKGLDDEGLWQYIQKPQTLSLVSSKRRSRTKNTQKMQL